MHQAPLIHRVAALAFVAFLAFATLPTTTAAEEPANGAFDMVGDVYPTAWAATLPGTAQHAELLDLAQFQVVGESKGDFVIELKVGDLPDDWKLEPAPPGGHPIPAIQLPEGQSISKLPQDYFDNKVNHSVFFTVDGKKYVAVVSLAEFNLANLQEFPRVSSTEYTLQLLDTLVETLRGTRNQVLANAPMLADIQHRTAAEDALSEAMKNSNDTRVLVVGLCDGQVLVGVGTGESCMATIPSEDRMTITTAFDEINEQLLLAKGNVHSALAPNLRAELDAAFAKAEAQYADAKAEFQGLDAPSATVEGGAAAPKPGDQPSVSESPTALLFHRFSLFRLDTVNEKTKMVELAEPGGLVDLKGNAVRLTIPKNVVGAEKGLKLSEFRAEASFKGVKVDYAPDAVAGNPGPQQIALGVVAQQVVTPAYGKDFEFAVAEPAPGETALPARIQLSPVGPASVEIAPGGSTTYYVTLKNLAATPLGGYFSLSPDGEGWVSQLSDPVWSLGPGSSQVFTVIVAGVQGASAEKITRLTATVDGGESTYSDLRTTMSAPPASEVGDGVGGEKKAKKGRLPGFESVALLTALAALVVVARRRLD